MPQERQRDRETERQRDRETERQRGRETERQRDRETERQRETKPTSADKNPNSFGTLVERIVVTHVNVRNRTRSRIWTTYKRR